MISTFKFPATLATGRMAEKAAVPTQAAVGQFQVRRADAATGQCAVDRDPAAI